jgi:two-component system NarL family response regulator
VGPTQAMKEDKRIRVMIVEDHFVVRVGLAAIINSQVDMVTVAEAEDGRHAVKLFEQHRPDVTLMDLRLPGLGGIEAIVAILNQFPMARVIVLSTFAGTEDVFRAVQAGARGYLLKDVKGPKLIDAIKAVHAGYRAIPPEIAAQLAERIAYSDLTPREREILSLIAKGFLNKEIAGSLSISEGTVRVHVSNVLLKLNCADRAQAVSEAIRRGVIKTD